MKKYLIIYNSKQYQLFVNRIKRFKDYTRIKHRVWCVLTDIEKTTEVRDLFDDIITDNDVLMVIDITKSPWAAVNIPAETVYWLKEK